ncbi:phage head morphogenesis protein [Paraburkholderia graminis]|uniref:phage head morphogenesis protein n=1 Tax=Paraburkholderia graminis TaxID=60548 RepID=UPI0038BD200E
MTLTLDRKRNRNPVKTQRIEQRYALQLRKVAQQVGSIVQPFTPGDMSQVPTIEHLLNAYSDMLKGWATQTASNMLMDVALRDEAAWQTMAKELSRGLREEIRNAPTGRVMQALLAEQVTLIQSIPLEASQRVHRLTLAGIEDSTRFQEIQKAILETESVTASRATLIARTETARTASVLTQARAESIGCTHAIWHTSHDGAVRKSHREMDGKVFALDKPPRLSDGTETFPGQIFNCRCWMEPIIDG